MTEENADNFSIVAKNMADTRGDQITIGDDGKLYAAFEAAGGNHIFFYDPKDIMKRRNDVFPKLDGWHFLANTIARTRGHRSF